MVPSKTLPFLLCAALGLACANAGLAQQATSPAPAPALGPVLIDGKPVVEVTFATGNTQTIGASQAHAPAGNTYTATPSTLCNGTVRVTGAASDVATTTVTSHGAFTLTRLGTPVGCAIAITSNAGGTPATVTFK